MSPPRVRAALVLIAAALVAVAAACGVEVPDDVAAEAATTTTTDGPQTTVTPTSDDELEQALIDNGYSLEEARCGAANLREELDDEEIQAIVDAATIEDISPDAAQEFADALRPCVEDGADQGGGQGPSPGPGGGDDGGGGDDDGDDGGGSEEREPNDGIGEEMPDFGDDSEGDVSRSRFLSALIVSGIPDEQARCVVDGVYAQLDQDDINVLFHADSADDVPDDVLATFDAIFQGCA